MSPQATARATARAVPRPTRARPSTSGPIPRSLRAVPTAPRTGHAGFVAICLATLIGGLVLVLVLNTSIAQGSFELSALQTRSNELTDAEDALGHSIDAQRAPAELARRALGRGMVPARAAAFLRLSDGKVLGVAEAATGRDGFSVVAQGGTSVSRSPGSPSATPTAGASTTVTPRPTRTVTRKGAVTTTTVTAIAGDTVRTTITSVDRATGTTTTTVTTIPLDPASGTAPTTKTTTTKTTAARTGATRTGATTPATKKKATTAR